MLLVKSATLGNSSLRSVIGPVCNQRLNNAAASDSRVTLPLKAHSKTPASSLMFACIYEAAQLTAWSNKVCYRLQHSRTSNSHFVIKATTHGFCLDFLERGQPENVLINLRISYFRPLFLISLEH
jgi:hypothetical protein